MCRNLRDLGPNLRFGEVPVWDREEGYSPIQMYLDRTVDTKISLLRVTCLPHSTAPRVPLTGSVTKRDLSRSHL